MAKAEHLGTTNEKKLEQRLKKFSSSERMLNDPSFDTKFNDALEAIKLASN